MFKKLSNELFLTLYTEKVKLRNKKSIWLYEFPTHTANISISDHKYADYKVEIYDGSNLVSKFYTTNLWNIN